MNTNEVREWVDFGSDPAGSSSHRRCPPSSRFRQQTTEIFHEERRACVCVCVCVCG